jgi:hypothetical protein
LKPIEFSNFELRLKVVVVLLLLQVPPNHLLLILLHFLFLLIYLIDTLQGVLAVHRLVNLGQMLLSGRIPYRIPVYHFLVAYDYFRNDTEALLVFIRLT